jgi:hypothetical protein
MSVLEDVYRLLSEHERQPVLVLEELDSIVDIDPHAADVLKGLADIWRRLQYRGLSRHWQTTTGSSPRRANGT